MKYKYLVSVVIDTYNYARYIQQAVDSALAQTVDSREFEVIIVDDGSIDDTATVVNSYGGQVKYLRKPNGGQASAFNLGVTAANGKIICFLDADDYFYPDKLKSILAVFDQKPDIGAVYNRYDLVDEQGKVIAKSVPKQLIGGDLSGRTLLGYVTGCPSSGISVLRDLAVKARIPEEPFIISADYFYLNVLPLMTQIGVVATSQHAYRVHSQNHYLAKSPADQQAIHSRQRLTIWNYSSEELNQEFCRAIFELQWIGQAQSVARQIKMLAVGIRQLINIHAPLGLKAWTLTKMCAQITLPPQAYSYLRALRGQVT